MPPDVVALVGDAVEHPVQEEEHLQPFRVGGEVVVRHEVQSEEGAEVVAPLVGKQDGFGD